MNPDKGTTTTPSIHRRGFLHEAAATAVAGGLVPAVRACAAPRLSIRKVEHVKIDGDSPTFCGHPRQCGIKSLSGGEVALLYRRSVASGPPERADVVLRRSCDGGLTWPARHEIVVWSDAIPLQQQSDFLCRDPAARSVLEMHRPAAMFFFGRTSLRVAQAVRETKAGWTSQWKVSGSGSEPCTVFQIRSVDGGRTWERVPLVLERPPKAKAFWKDNHPLVTMPDGALVGAVESDGAVWLYGSENQGMTWQYLSLVAMEKGGSGKPSCAGLLLLPDGRLQCYLLVSGNETSTLCVSESADGFSWSEPRECLREAQSPWPLRMRDGRTMVLFARRRSPRGIGMIASADDGQSWSAAAMLREDRAGPEIGNAAAVELDDGRIFAAYQYPSAAEGGKAGACILAGSLFQPA